ncbi:MAG: aminoacyl-tRNA deacylase [Pseudonocardiaceae bacterium]
MTRAEPLTPIEILRTAGVAFSCFSHPPIRTYDDIVRELRLPADQLLKTMAFRTDGGKFVLISLPILSAVKYGRLAKATGVPRSQLRRAGPDDLKELGTAPGGVSPLTFRSGTLVAFDTSVRAMETVYCGSGRDDETIKIEASSLIEVVQPLFAQLAADESA